ncbi:hypothetical protein [Pedobacter sp.]|uniref:helix-hairpin-helix domain-containing protein n=1 Tax=Pedobacter sp. TaxID=1411316 RepID=UPI003D7F7186
MGISCLGPDVNHSRRKFSVDPGGDVRFGLAAIKGLGSAAAEAVILEREQNGEFTSIYDFVQRVSMNALKRSGMECLAMSGAFDCFAPGIRREQFFVPGPKGEPFLETLMRYGTSYQQMKFKYNARQFLHVGD